MNFSKSVTVGGDAMVLDEARMKLERCIKHREKPQGLEDLEEGLQDLRDVLEGDSSTKDKERAGNLIHTYRNELLGWINRELFGENGRYGDPYRGAYCRQAIELFDQISKLVGMDEQFNAVKQKVTRLCEHFAEKRDDEISVRDIIEKVLSLDEAGQEAAVDLLRKIGINVRSQLEKEKARRLTSQRAQAERHNAGESARAGPTTQVFEYRVQGAMARLAVRPGAYVILKDSTALAQERESIPEGARRRRRDLMRQIILIPDRRANLLRFTEDISFDSPSAASAVVSASSTNGWICFKMPNGKTLKQIMHR
jgi:hypothetical protein